MNTPENNQGTLYQRLIPSARDAAEAEGIFEAYCKLSSIDLETGRRWAEEVDAKRRGEPTEEERQQERIRRMDPELKTILRDLDLL